VTLWGSLAGGAVGAVLLTTGLRIAQELGLTRMDVPLLLGTIFTGDRRAAIVAGVATEFALGVAFALLYAGVFYAVGRSGWLLGIALGAVHGLFVGGVLLPVLLPPVNPRMGSPWSDADETPLLEPPGFMLVNYGRQTAVVTFALHLAYGALVGGFAAGLS
jgi:hypothetical protein